MYCIAVAPAAPVCGATPVAGGGRRVVLDGLGDGEEDQADPHPGAEHHGDPGQRVELRLVLVGAEPDPAEPGRRDDHREHQERVGGHHEQPAEGADDPGQARLAEAGQGSPGQHAPRHHGQYAADAEHQHQPVDPAHGGAPSRTCPLMVTPAHPAGRRGRNTALSGERAPRVPAQGRRWPVSRDDGDSSASTCRFHSRLPACQPSSSAPSRQ